MSTPVLERPRAAPAPAPPSPARDDLPSVRRHPLDGGLTLAVVALLACACLPFARVYVGLDWVRPVLGAVVLAAGVAWACRRIGASSAVAALSSVAAWAVYTTAVFAPGTLVAGVLPTLASAGAALEMVERGFELVRTRPSPVLPEPELLLLTVSGVWAITLLTDELVFRLRAPLKAILAALVLFVVPLSLSAPAARAWAWVSPLLVCAALLLLGFAGSDLARWGSWVRHGGARTGWGPASLGGWLMAACAITAGALVAPLLPGYGDPPWYELRGRGGTTLTTNPIVALRPSLVAQDTGPIMRVRSERPVYLRTTALDVYGDAEEWTNAGIVGRPLLDGRVPDRSGASGQPVQVEVEIADLEGAVLVPAPYQVLRVHGQAAGQFQYDPATATFTLDRGATLDTGDTYTLDAVVPAPPPQDLDGAQASSPPPGLTALPDNVPDEVAELARRITDEAGARTPFEQALAIQQELRTWTYSLDPPQGHSATAMLSFLETRTGYCEQFAGTMAVMLRTLGIPARVAVGFTPGELVDPGESLWSVSNRNAHAWVEVLFPGPGWVPFEPTPRSDGNVLVPTEDNLAPATTSLSPVLELDPSIPDDMNLVPGQERAPGSTGGLDAGDGSAGAPGVTEQGWAGPALVALVAMLPIAVWAYRRWRPRRGDRPPAERVLRAYARAERLGHGLGVRPGRWETAREYITRLASSASRPPPRSSRDLADLAARTRYARADGSAGVGMRQALEAEAAVADLEEALLAPLGPLRRARARARARLAWTLQGLRPSSEQPPSVEARNIDLVRRAALSRRAVSRLARR